MTGFLPSLLGKVLQYSTQFDTFVSNNDTAASLRSVQWFPWSQIGSENIIKSSIWTIQHVEWRKHKE